MKTKLALIFAAATLATGLVRAAQAPAVLTIAVFDFESKDEAVRDLGRKVSALVGANLSAQPELITVERAELDKILSEHEIGLSGNVTPDTAARVGQLTGAKVLVSGRVFRDNNDVVVVAKVMGTETSRVYGEFVRARDEAGLTEMCADLAKKIAAITSQKGDTLVAKVVTREERVERIKKALKADKLPVVSVKIAERHFGGVPITIDPAAETEFNKLLAECGFKVADDKSSLKPDIEITGEALSEFGMRKGNLVACKARVEIKARDRASGNLLVVDRQTSVAVDLTEQVAAKTALQNAALDLAERAFPKLTK